MGQLKYFLCLCAALHIGAHGVFGKNILEIGKPDASAAEFNDFGVDFNGARYYFDETKTDPYEASKKFFASPVKYDAQKNSASDFPFVFPAKNCEWADPTFKRQPESKFYYPQQNRYKAYNKKKECGPASIFFNLDSAPRDLYLKIGFIDKAPISADIKIQVSSNGKEVSEGVSVPYKRTPQNKYPCFENILFNSKTWGIPAGISVKIPAEALKEGRNEISLRVVADKKIGATPPMGCIRLHNIVGRTRAAESRKSAGARRQKSPFGSWLRQDSLYRKRQLQRHSLVRKFWEIFRGRQLK